MRALATVLLTLLISGFIGCKRNEQSNAGATTSPSSTAGAKGRPLIGVSLLTLSNPFFKEIADALQSEGAKRGYDVVTMPTRIGQLS